MRYALALSTALIVLAACGPKEDTPVAANEPAPAEAPATPPASTTPDASTPLTAEGWGPLKIGMTLAEVTQAAGADANPNAVGGPDEQACNEFHPENAPEGLRVMLEQGKLSRISLSAPSAVKTDKGFGPGDTAEAIKAGYGNEAKSSPHKYQDKPAEYVTFWSGGPRNEPYVQDPAARGIVYEIDSSGKASVIHAGGPSIQLVEGCA